MQPHPPSPARAGHALAAEAEFSFAPAHMRGFLDALNQACGVFDRTGRTLHLNPAFLRLTGHAAEGLPDLAAWWRLSQPDPARCREVRVAWEAALAAADPLSGRIPPFEADYRLAGGLVVRLRCAGTLGDEGLMLSWEALPTEPPATDVPRTNPASGLEAGEPCFSDPGLQALLDFIFEGIGVHQAGRFVYANAALAGMLDLPQQAVVGRDVLDFLLPEMHERVGAFLHDPEARSHLEVMARSAAGRVFHCELLGKPCRYQGRPARLVAVRDISQRHRAEAYRRESLWLNLALLVSHAGTWEWRIASDEMVWSEHLWLLYGLEQAPEAQHFERWLAVIHPDDRERVRADMRQAAAMVRETAIEYRVIWPDGSLHWLLSHGHPLLDAADRLERYIGVVVDITGRKQAELAYQASEARFLALFENIDAISIQGYRPDGTVTYWNPASQRIYGYTREEALGRDLRDLVIPPALREEVSQAVAWMFVHRQGVPAGRLCLRHKDGRPVHVYSSHTVVEDADGTATLFCLDVDLTELVRVEEALRVRERYIQAILDNFPFMVWLKDRDSRFLAANRPLAQTAGLDDPAAMIGGTDLDFWPAGMARRFLLEDQAVMSEGRSSIFEQYLPFSGRNFWFEVFKAPVELDGVRIGTVGFARDITERKQADDLLRTQKDFLDAVVEHAGNIIVVLDGAGRIVRFNRAAEEITGFSFAELEHRYVWDHLIPPERQDDVRAVFDQLLHDRVVGIHEHEWLMRDGSRRLFSWHNTVLRDAAGRIGHVVALGYDITDFRRTEQELRRHRDELEQIVVERTRSLTQAIQEAEAASQAKGTFLAKMSHEIRTPLNGVLGMAQIGYRDNVHNPSARGVFARILESGQLLLTIINDVLDFSKIEAGKLTVESLPLDPGLLLDKVVDVVRFAAERKQLPIRVTKYPGLPPACMGDPARISQILLNLLSNAIKFTEQGEIRLKAGRDGDTLVLRVEDTGIGIASADLERLFRPFEQLDGSVTRKYGGTGLGLAISQRLAELLGGSLLASSTPGQGSAFTLRLPFLEADPAALEGAPESGGVIPRLAGLRVLVAEDNVVNQLILEDLLRREGAQVSLAANGRLAVAAVAAGQIFDLVLMDVQMPEMDGLEASRQLRELVPELPIVGQTAHALPEEHQRCLEAGMRVTLSKPIELDELVRVIRSVLSPAAIVPGPECAGSPAAGSGIDWRALQARFPGRPEFIEQLIRVSLDSHAGDPAALRALAGSGDHPQLARLAHAIKGLGGNLCASEVWDAAAALLDAVRARRPDIDPLALHLASALERLLAELERGDNHVH